jgi:hypothetical protein
MAKTFLRFQEFYESPKFRGKIFSLKEFKDWYKTTRKGKFTYYTDWAGFNIPSTVLRPFYDKQFKNLTVRELTLLRKFKDIKGKFYIIATTGKSSMTLNHEISHARFYINGSYRKEILAALGRVNTTSIAKWLLGLGYDQSTLLDEIHAYLLNDWVGPRFLALVKTLKQIEKKYY